MYIIYSILYSKHCVYKNWILYFKLCVYNKVAAHRSFKPPKHDLGRVQSIQKWRRCAICAIQCQKKHENVSRSSNAVWLTFVLELSSKSTVTNSLEKCHRSPLHPNLPLFWRPPYSLINYSNLFLKHNSNHSEFTHNNSYHLEPPWQK